MGKTEVLIGDIVKTHRKDSGLSQLEVADRLGYESSQFIHLIEQGKSKIPPSQINKICRILGIHPKIIFDIIVEDFVEKLSKQVKIGPRP